MVELVNLLKFLMCYTLCVVYSGWITFGILIAYIFKKDTKFWEVKNRPTTPQALTSNEFGEHKFMTVNVSATDLCFAVYSFDLISSCRVLKFIMSKVEIQRIN